MVIGFFHLGNPEHGVCRYGRLLAREAKKRSNLHILESQVILTGDQRNDNSLLIEAACNLSEAQVVHIQFTEEIWGNDWNRFHHLQTFIKHCKSPIIVTIHDTEPPPKSWISGHLVKRLRWSPLFEYLWQAYQDICFAIRDLRYKSGLIPQFVLDNARIRRWLIRHTHLSLVCTKEEKNRLCAITTYNNVVVLPHFVEERYDLPTREEARKSLKLEGYKVITLLGFIYGGKGHRLLLEALALLPDKDILVVFAGESAVGYENQFAELMDFAKTLGVTKRLRVTGYLEEKNFEQYLMATDLPVCPFRICYASGSLSSWISACRPILASDLPLFREYNEFEPEAINIFSPYTPSALAGSIQKMLNDLPSNGIDPKVVHLREKLSMDIIFDKHLVHFQHVLSESYTRA